MYYSPNSYSLLAVLKIDNLSFGIIVQEFKRSLSLAQLHVYKIKKGKTFFAPLPLGVKFFLWVFQSNIIKCTINKLPFLNCLINKTVSCH